MKNIEKQLLKFLVNIRSPKYDLALPKFPNPWPFFEVLIVCFVNLFDIVRIITTIRLERVIYEKSDVVH